MTKLKVTRVALSYYVTSGLSAALGLFLISGGMRLWAGSFAAAAASIGVIVVIPPDQPSPRRGKFWHMLPSVLVGVPLFFAVHVLHAEPLRFCLLLVPATFLAFLGAAWGRRGIPLSMSAMFAIVFAMAIPTGVATRVATGIATGAAAGPFAGAGWDGPGALLSTAYFALGAAAYLIYATVANTVLNGVYREQMLADTLLSMASLMRAQAAQFVDRAVPQDGVVNPIGELLRGQAALADQLQSARDMLLESPRTARRQRLAGMLMVVLEIRDQLLASELDVDLVLAHPDQAPTLALLRLTLNDDAAELEHVADCLLTRRSPAPFSDPGPRLDGRVDALAPSILALGLAARVKNIGSELTRLSALARGEAEPELAVVRASWKMFISPTAWSWQPITGLWHWDAPPLRHAIRAALAIATAYGISLAVPWGTHAYWILLTIVVVLRGSLAQTLERRNSRVAGTVVGSLLAGALLSLRAPAVVIMLIVTLAQGVAHAFAVKRYLVTAIAATILALLQAHLLHAEVSPTFEMLERVADTFIGVAVAWAFSYVLPAWERTQIPALVQRVLEAQARHARLCLELSQLTTVDDRPELQWRLARREAYDSLSALVQATQRSLAEPRAVQPPLEPLGRLLARSYQLLAQLTAVKTTLLMRRGHLDAAQLSAPLQQASRTIDAELTRPALTAGPREAGPSLPPAASSETLVLPDPFGLEVTPWLLRRLRLAGELAAQLAHDALQASEIAPMARSK
jgi:uncharacterized membrane protein YccC